MGAYSSLLLSLRAKHAPTAAHCMRVASSISAWGIYHRLPHLELESFELLGLLHDIGKIGVPERILQKSTSLLPEERAIVELHPQVGVEILRSAGAHPTLIESIQHLGAWFDGSNRTGKVALPLSQRILSIVDAYDAMTTEQTYRKAMSQDAALMELNRMSGTQFDPQLVASFIEVVVKSSDQLRHAVEQRWMASGHSQSMAQLFQHDHSSHHNASAAIDALNQVFHRQMIDNMNDGVIFVDTELRILEWNKSTERLTGRGRATVLHNYWTPELVGMHDEEGLQLNEAACPFRELLLSSDVKSRRLRLTHVDGRPIQVDAQFMPVFDDRNILRGGALMMGDASNQVVLEERVQELHARATLDPLTKVFNRAELNRQIPEFISRCQNEKRPGSVIICDIDFFKRINDTFGHSAGDQALVAFGGLLKQHARSTDVIARFGGEEFVMLCHDCDLVSAIRIAEDIRLDLERTPISALKGKCLSASFGVSDIGPHDSAEKPLERADQCLLHAKQNGRNRVESAACRDAIDTKHELCTEGIKQPPETRAGSPGGWLSWLAPRNAGPIISGEFLLKVPREVVVEKFRGYIAETGAEVLALNYAKIEIQVDSKNALVELHSQERTTRFNLSIALKDVEYAAPGRTEQLVKAMTMKVDVSVVRARDRRNTNIEEQAIRVLNLMARQLAATPIDSSLRERVIPIYVPGSDGR